MTAVGPPAGRHADAPPATGPGPAVPVFDAHCHLDAMAHRAGEEPTAAFVGSVMAEARAVGVTRVISVGDTVASSRWCVSAAAAHPGVFAAVAVHPTEVNGVSDDDYDELARLACDDRVVAVGETGLDYYWDRTAPDLQAEHFWRHIALAKRVGKALMIHDREAHADVLRILREEGAPDRVVFHSFSGDAAMARQCADAGYVLSFSGVITFKNAPALREAAAVAPIDQVLVETDAPFLTPHPHRGRPNAPRYLPLTIGALAAAGGHDLDTLAAAVQQTGRRIFGLPG